jgi:hypothetical protein
MVTVDIYMLFFNYIHIIFHKFLTINLNIYIIFIDIYYLKIIYYSIYIISSYVFLSYLYVHNINIIYNFYNLIMD